MQRKYTVSMINPMINPFDKYIDSDCDSFDAMNKKSSFSSYNAPRANIMETSEGYSLQLSTPGYSRNDFMLEVDSSMNLKISVKGNENQKLNKDQYLNQEYDLGSWDRSWTLPKGAFTEQITARYDAGILYVDIPCESSPKSKKRYIDVE
jgi:HSP20 family protein